MLYTTIKDTELLFEDLTAETPYSFKIRAVNKDGHSDWAEFKATTKANPLEFALPEILAEITAADQGGQEVANLFDYDESSMWHTQWGANAIPFDLVMDLRTINQLDKFHYLPRTDGGNGVILKGSVYYSMDKENWTEAGSFEWERNGEVKVFDFPGQPTARYVKINVTKGVGNYGSGRELYVFKVPGTESYRPGDINNDRLIDMNDFTSYMNYTGLRQGDAEFEGYVSNGDVNRNGLIDAYDISVVATQLRGGVKKEKAPRVEGTLQLSTPKQNYSRNEIIEVRVKGNKLRSVNALSFSLPYNQQDYEFIGVEPLHMNAMENLTNDRLHTNGTKALYPTFVNIGEKKTLEGNEELFILKFKARNNLKFDLKLQDGLLVDKHLNTHKF